MLKFPTGPVHKDFVPVIRYSEVLLNLAEAKARLAGTAVDASALTLLNAVRSRSTTAYAAADIATGTALVSAILTERNIEFLGEGFRSIDLQRNLLALLRNQLLLRFQQLRQRIFGQFLRQRLTLIKTVFLTHN